MRIGNFWRNIVVIFQHSLGMYEIIIMPVRIICTPKEISKMLLKDSSSNVNKRIWLWTCKPSQPNRMSLTGINRIFNHIPSWRNMQMMRQQKNDVVHVHSITTAHRIASVPMCRGSPRCTVFYIPLV